VAQGAGVRPGMALPVRVHDLLLTFAGRIDDDGLADARELLASMEVDRALEFLVGCLVAGRVAVTGAQRAELDALFAEVRLDPSGLGRLVVDESAGVLHHRFGGGTVDGESAALGVAEAASMALDVLPDVRSVFVVWRLTPAGPVSGPVPHRVVLVGVGPNGTAPATSLRLEHALRAAGIRASVEVLRDGAEAPDYHHAAMQHATQVPFARQAPGAPAPVRVRPTVVNEPPPPRSLPQPPLPAPPLPPPPPPPLPPPPPPAPVLPPLQVPEISAPTTRRSRPEPPADPLASTRINGNGNGGRMISDEPLTEQERNLLAQLQEELVRREREESSRNSNSPTMINGIPPQYPDRPPR
jgi:hypothetical protein